jgi:hypothetical protein
MPDPNCPVCLGKGRVRRAQGFFTLEPACPRCSPTSKTEAKLNRSGYVYILSLTAGVIKIGHTQKHPENRAAEWELKLLAYARAEDSADAEKRMHSYLADYRHGKYELFEISFRQTISALELVVGPATIVRQP